MNHEKIPLKRFHKVCGIYVAIHRESGMCYVGSSIDIRNRIRCHVWAAKRGSKLCFHRALSEFGFNAFDFECVKECPKQDLLEWEKVHIALLGAASLDGFNTLPTPHRNRLGTPCSSVTKQRISAAQVGRKFTDEHRRQLSDSHRGNAPSQATRDKMSAARIGRKLSQKHRDSLMAANKGRIVSEETRQKMRERRLGVPLSAQARANLSTSMKAVRAVKKW